MRLCKMAHFCALLRLFWHFLCVSVCFYLPNGLQKNAKLRILLQKYACRSAFMQSPPFSYTTFCVSPISAFQAGEGTEPELEIRILGTLFQKILEEGTFSNSVKWWFSLPMTWGFWARDSGPRDRALSAPRHCLDAYKNDREKGVTRPHRAPVAQNGILVPENIQIRNVQIRTLAVLDFLAQIEHEKSSRSTSAQKT